MKSKHYLVMILILGAILRCLFINTRSIQYDDAFSFFLSIRSFSEIVSGTAADTMPPLYYFLLHIWSLVSTDLWWLRLLSALLSLSGILVLFWLTKVLDNEKTALWAAFLCAISPFQIYHAQDLRMYALLQLCELIYVLSFVHILMSKKQEWVNWNWIGFVVGGTLAMYTHNLAVFFIILPNIVLVLKRKWKLFFRILPYQILIAVLSLPWLVMIPGQFRKIQTAFWTPVPGLSEIIQAIMVFNSNLPLPSSLVMISAVLSLFLFFGLLIEIYFEKGKRNKYFLPAMFGLLLPVLLFIVSYLIRPVFVPRGFIISSLFYYIILAMLILRQDRKVLSYGLLGLYLVSVVIGYPFQMRFLEFPRSPFQQAVNDLSQKVKTGDLILHDNKLSYLPMLYYAPDLSMQFLADEPGSFNDTFAAASQEAMQIFPLADLDKSLHDSQMVYFVVFTKTIEEYKQMGYSDHPILFRLKKEFSQEHVEFYNDLEIHEFMDSL